MVIKVGINGFGRIGRIVSRACLQNSGLQLSAINDPAISVEYVSYLLKFDSTHGKLNGVITCNEDEVVINGQGIKVYHEKYPSSVPWAAAGVQYVVEASGMFTSYEKAAGHLISIGVKRVIVTAPSVDVPMLVLGVNDKSVPPERRVISCASSTLYCLAPIIKVLEDSCGVEEGFLTSIHAMTPSLKPLDGLCLRGRHWRDHRSIHQNIIPAPTGACKALGKILPRVKDKLSGLAFRVPIVNVSVLDLTIRLRMNTTLQEIVNNVHQASKSTLRNIIKVSNEEAVSSDFTGESHSCIFDEASSIQLKPNFFKLICWYENEFSYACRIIDSIIYSENQYFLEIPKSLGKLRRVTSTKILQTDIPLKCTCKNELTADISTITQDTVVGVRTPSLPLSEKSSITTKVNTPKTWSKTDELLKIWNNRCLMSPCTKRIRRSFFQSCAGFTSSAPVKKVECNNQERLESVRREFTKMVSITEDLLRKTQSNQGVRSTKDEGMGVSRVNLLAKEKDAKSFTKMSNNNNSVEERVDCKCSGDIMQTQYENLNKNGQISLVASLDEKSEFSDSNNAVKDSKNLIDISEAVKDLIKNDRDEDSKVLTNLDEEKHNEFVKLDRGECITKSDVGCDGSAQDKEFQCVWNHELNTYKNIDKASIAPDKVVTEMSISNRERLSNEKNNTFPETNSENGKEEIALGKCEFTAKTSNINLIGEALRKRNIVLVNATCEINSDACTEEIDDSPADSIDKIEEDVIQVTEPDPEQVHFPVKIDSRDSKCTTPENTITTISNGCEHRQDIYDKLDSTSGSDSNNSFEIKERRSQVIQLADLTNSLEDLTRLNNICRIIEISDELSDKLFSTLDSSGTDMKKKRWSFKDLCARIKLDDFCNKVFGGTAVTHE